MSTASSVPATGRARPHIDGPLVGTRRTTQARVLAVTALVVSAGYLTWRATATLVPEFWWLSVPLLLLEIHAFLGLGLFAFSLWDVDAGPTPRAVSTAPGRVAVLIPTYNESVEVLLPTIAAAVAVNLPHETWVLDDGARPEVAALAGHLGARYLARLERHDAKAGNLNHALSYIDADFVAVLDADHVARPELLQRTLGYFDDPRVALVQTPQDFYNELSFEHAGRRAGPAYQEQALFYRAIQPGKNRWKAAFWCGTGAVLRTAALRDVGGVATGTVTEDIQTTLRLHRAGWSTVYHNEVLARGLAAATAEQYAVQRYRWCTGAMQVLRTERPLRGPRLTLPQRLAYASTLLGWFDAWRTLGYVLLPSAVLFTGGTPIRAHAMTLAVAFGLTFALQQLALWRLGRGLQRPLPVMVFEFIRLAPTLRATLALLTGGSRRFRVTEKGATASRRVRTPRLLLALLALSFGAWCWYLATLAGVTPTHFSDPWVAHGAAFWLVANTLVLSVAITRVLRRRFAGERRGSVRMRVPVRGIVDGCDAEVLDLSLTGAQLLTPTRPGSKGEQVTLALDLGAGPATFSAVIRQLSASRRRWMVGVEFAHLDPAGRARLALAIYAAAPQSPARTPLEVPAAA